MAILFVFSDHLLPPYSRDQHLAILKELNAHHLMTGVEYFAFHHCRNIVEYVVACIIQKRANHRQGCHVASEILHQVINRRALVKLFEGIQWHPLKVIGR